MDIDEKVSPISDNNVDPIAEILISCSVRYFHHRYWTECSTNPIDHGTYSKGGARARQQWNEYMTLGSKHDCCN